MGKRGPQPGASAHNASKRAAQTLITRYGAGYFSEIGTRGVLTQMARPDFIAQRSRAGLRGGTTTLERYGYLYFVALGEQSAVMRKEVEA